MNQGSCGSSEIFASVSMVESAHFIASGKMEKLSLQQVEDCAGGTGSGCNGGWGSAMTYIAKYGLMRAEDYKSQGGKCGYDASKVAVKVQKVINVKPMSDTELENALLKSPVMVGIEADQMAFQTYQSGILSGNCGTSLDHMALAVGFEE